MSCRTAHIRAMRAGDLPAVLAIEETVFGDDAWPRSFFARDLANAHAAYFALELASAADQAARAELVGYAGYWLLDDEANLMNIAVTPAWQGRGLGEFLLLGTLAELQRAGATVCTLEVRVSNARAQALYRKLGFEVTGRRRHYYQDNGEDALLMTAPSLDSAPLADLHRERRAELDRRMQHSLCA